MKIMAAAVGTIFVVIFTIFEPQTSEKNKNTLDACITLLSGFPRDVPESPTPQYPTDTTDVTLEYFASGCYGACPAFTLRISNRTAVFEGHDYVRAKGKRTAKLSPQEFETLLHAWYDGKFYAMRDDYCTARCPDGVVHIVTDIADSSITLTTPTFKKRVYECFFTMNNQPQTPKPPEQYFQLSQQLLALAKSHRWL
jgi:hypothetical protein